MRDRALNSILARVRAGKPNRMRRGISFSLKTLLVAVAIVMLSATTAFAAYGAGLNAAPPPEQPDVNVEQFNELIAALQEENAELNDKVAELEVVVEELREQLLMVAQYDSREETPTGKAFNIDWGTVESLRAAEIAAHSTMAEAAATVGGPFKEPGWLPEGTTQGEILSAVLGESRYPSVITYYQVASGKKINLYQYYFGPDHQVNLDTIYDAEKYMVGDTEVIVIYRPTSAGIDLHVYWMDADGVFNWMLSSNNGSNWFDLETALAIVASMGTPVSAK